MKNKLLSAVSIAIISSLSTQSFAITNSYQDNINSPDNHPEHRYEDNRTTFEIENDKIIEEKINKLVDIADTLAPVVDVIAHTTETASPLIKMMPYKGHNKKENNEPEYSSPEFQTLMPVIDVISHATEATSPLAQKTSEKNPNNLPVVEPLPTSPTSSTYSTNTVNHLENRVIDNNRAINLLNNSVVELKSKSHDLEKSSLKDRSDTAKSIHELQSSLSNLEKNVDGSEIKNKKYVDDEVFRSEAITTLLIDDTNKKHETDTKQLNVAIEKLDKDIRESDLITSQLIEDAEKNSKAHADLILRNQQMLNIDRFAKLDKQEKLQTQQLKQINTRVDQMESKIRQTARDANAGIASVAAMTNIPYTTNTRFSAGLGLGNFKNGNAIAAGAQYQVKQNLNLRSSISWNNSDRAVIGAGIAYGW